MILNIETATRNCSVSLADKGKTICYKELSELGYSHAEKLHVFIEDVMAMANCKFENLTAIAVSQGPGSYTGLRIGVSAAKGFCYALNIPLLAIDTLEILARQVTQNEGHIIPMIDARRMEVYSALFDTKFLKLRAVAAEIITQESYSNIKGKIYIVGDCQQKIKTVLQDERFVFNEQIEFPSAQNMSELSYIKFQNNQFEDLAYFEPYYLKDFLITSSSKK